MKRIALFVLLFSFISAASFAQENKTDTIPPYLKYPDLPAFKVRLLDSITLFNTYSIKPGKPTMLILFGADCEHCKHFTDSLTRHMDEFKDVQIYMFTFSPFADLRKFTETYKLKDYKNIVMGQDNEFFYPSYYKVNSVPGIAIYDKNKKFVKLFTGSVKIEDIAAATR
jgi:thioredoxin-related protein